MKNNFNMNDCLHYLFNNESVTFFVIVNEKNTLYCLDGIYYNRAQLTELCFNDSKFINWVKNESKNYYKKLNKK